ncbi:MAG: methylated-DNA--[protein]-cysteine S-methyltransferase [Actinophytocola sp.]|uniref:methylated-DNA--[protein]-cysteine S-methyltransferase n=1 Tax=Actinophytocola sp. TaxID=1872138 RepID=UPI0013298E61|nr:methylated-DNA--[protein]-cysteine S-methyltransferase [Actinophytocola sp.]MPZ79315.1 methylated-DNA--[protein]-cysteine S-methyltransferase [Actinophytocola sp.]
MVHAVMDSPIGSITLVGADGELSGLYMERQRYAPESYGERDDGAFPDAVEQLTEYFAGTRTEFDLRLAPKGTPFQQQVWAALREVRYGETTTYGELAATIGRPTASRAVGHANGHNPISIVVPCHRVIGTTGSLTGYGGGLPRKRFLLALEAGTPALL